MARRTRPAAGVDRREPRAVIPPATKGSRWAPGPTSTSTAWDTSHASLSAAAGSWSARGAWVTLVEDSLVVTATVPLAGGRSGRGRGCPWRPGPTGLDLLILLDQVPLESLSGRLLLDLTADSLLGPAEDRRPGGGRGPGLLTSSTSVPGTASPVAASCWRRRRGAEPGASPRSTSTGSPTRGPRASADGGVARRRHSVKEIDYELRLAGERVALPLQRQLRRSPGRPRPGAWRGSPSGPLVKGTVSLQEARLRRPRSWS